MPSILCVYTGGTIGCEPSPEGLAPAAHILQAPIAALARELEISVDWLELEPLLDSSSMGPADWNRISAHIATDYADYTGFVILHGTDTLVYTAAALHYQFENLGKPIILTGSQRPWLQNGSDAPANVRAAFIAAATRPAGVRIVFGSQELPAWGARKIDTEADNAFMAPDWDGTWPAVEAAGPWRRLQIQPELAIAGFKLYPGASYDLLAATLLQQPLAGLVLECYGTGNLPNHPQLLAALSQQARQGCHIVICSQCPHGPVHLGHYAASQPLAHWGATSAAGLTPEAALVRLYVQLSQANTL